MKKVIYIIIMVLVLFAYSLNSFADSPMLSISFSDLYANDYPIIATAQTTNTLSTKTMEFLESSDTPIAAKAAVINAIGCNSKPQYNAQKFIDYLSKTKNSKIRFSTLSAHELFCIGYLKATDSYFDYINGTDNNNFVLAEKYLNMAKAKNSKSLTINLITALIESNRALYEKSSEKLALEEWAKLGEKPFQNIFNNKNLNNDMTKEAVNRFYEYISTFGGNSINTEINKDSTENLCIDKYTTYMDYLGKTLKDLETTLNEVSIETKTGTHYFKKENIEVSITRSYDGHLYISGIESKNLNMNYNGIKIGDSLEKVTSVLGKSNFDNEYDDIIFKEYGGANYYMTVSFAKQTQKVTSIILAYSDDGNRG